MMNHKTKMWIAAGIVALMAGTGTALAATETPAAPAAPSGDAAAQTQQKDVLKFEKHGMKGGKFLMKGDQQALLDFLKITQEELCTAREAQKTLLDVATEQGIAKDALVDFLLESHSKHIDQAVTDGKIDAEKAAEMKANLTREKIEAMVSSKGPAFGKGGPHGSHGEGKMVKFRKGAPQDGQAAAEQPATEPQVQQQSYQAL